MSLTVKFDTAPLLAAAQQINTQMAAFQEQIVKSMPSVFRTLAQQEEIYADYKAGGYTKKALTWTTGITSSSMKGQSIDLAVIDEGVGFKWGAIDAPQARPRPVSREEILTSLEKIVTAVGPSYIATSHGTNNMGADGRRCVQGELMVNLGFLERADPATYLPGSHDAVSALFCVEGDPVAYAVLEEAESMNDRGEEWGDILKMAKKFFAKAA